MLNRFIFSFEDLAYMVKFDSDLFRSLVKNWVYHLEFRSGIVQEETNGRRLFVIQIFEQTCKIYNISGTRVDRRVLCVLRKWQNRSQLSVSRSAIRRFLLSEEGPCFGEYLCLRFRRASTSKVKAQDPSVSSNKLRMNFSMSREGMLTRIRKDLPYRSLGRRLQQML